MIGDEETEDDGDTALADLLAEIPDEIPLEDLERWRIAIESRLHALEEEAMELQERTKQLAETAQWIVERQSWIVTELALTREAHGRVIKAVTRGNGNGNGANHEGGDPTA